MKNNNKEELSDIINEIEIILNEEENYRDNMPENMYGGYKYEMADEACDNLSYASSYLSEALDCNDYDDYIQTAIQYLTDASI